MTTDDVEILVGVVAAALQPDIVAWLMSGRGMGTADSSLPFTSFCSSEI